MKITRYFARTDELWCQNQKIKVVESGKLDTPNTKMHDRSLSWLGTGTSIKTSGVKLVLWT